MSTATPIMIMLLAAMSSASPSADFVPSAPVEARRAVQDFGACAADLQLGEAARVLRMDFTRDGYRIGLKLLGREAERPCARKSFGIGKLRSSGLLFAGALAERLIARDSSPLNVRLARAAATARPVPRTRSDAAAICAVRSAPDDAGRLFASSVGSDAEAAAARSMSVAMRMCAGAATPLQVNVEGLRAMLATAAFRLLDSVGPAGKGADA